MAKKGKGWHGERMRHSEAAKKGAKKSPKPVKTEEKDEFYERDISPSRRFNNKSYNYQGTYRTKLLAEKEIEKRLENIAEPVEVLYTRIIPTSKGYRVYTRYDDTIEIDLLRLLVDEAETDLHTAYVAVDYKTKQATEKSIQKLIDAGFITKKVGEYEIIYKPTKEGKNLVTW